MFPGVGSVLHFYRSNGTGTKINLNFRSKIFGICSSSGAESIKTSPLALVYGGREFALVRIQGEECKLELIKSFPCEDWVNSIHLYDECGGDSLRLCLLTSHNSAFELLIQSNGHLETLNRSGCVDKCTLYSSLVSGESWEKTTVCGSNAFGELIIWNVHGGCLDAEVLVRLKAHNVNLISVF